MSDLGHLRRHLGLRPGPLVAHGNDFMLATELARRHPAEVTQIIGVSAAFPIESPEDYARLGKWARFFLANARYAPRVLTLLGKGAYAYARAVGFETYVEQVMRGTADADALRNPDVRAAVIAGSEVMFGPRVRAHDAFAADVVAVYRDWQPEFGSLGVPVTLFHGEQDPNCPFEAAAELSRRYEGWRLLSFPDAGHFACHVHWRPLVQVIADSVLPG
jgi:pimeloyl-ACP methyl ester carboxylesterase